MKTKEKDSYLEECEKFAWDFVLFQDSYFYAIPITFFLILEIFKSLEGQNCKPAK